MSEASAREMAGAARRSSKMMILVGVLTIILGTICLAAPFVAGVAVARVAGWLLIFGGVLRGFLAFKAGSFGKGLLAFLIGVLTLVAGLMMVARPLFALASLTLVLAFYFLIDGASEIALAFQAKPNPGWGWMLFGGLVSILLGIAIWSQWPMSGAWAIGILVGIKLIFAGWGEIAMALAARATGGEAKEAAAAT